MCLYSLVPSIATSLRAILLSKSARSALAAGPCKLCEGEGERERERERGSGRERDTYICIYTHMNRKNPQFSSELPRESTEIELESHEIEMKHLKVG